MRWVPFIWAVVAVLVGCRGVDQKTPSGASGVRSLEALQDEQRQELKAGLRLYVVAFYESNKRQMILCLPTKDVAAIGGLTDAQVRDIRQGLQIPIIIYRPVPEQPDLLLVEAEKLAQVKHRQREYQ